MSAIRILQSLSTLDYSGAEAMIMNLYRNIDRDKIQFDFVVNDRTEPFVFEKEVEKLGGRIFTLPKFSGTNFVLYRKKVNQLLQNHPEWKIIHIHNASSAMLMIDLAKKHELVTIAHAHFDQDFINFKSYVQKILRVPIKNNADYLLACSKLAGAFVFNVNKEEIRVIKNAIEPEKYRFNEKMRRRKRAELGLKNEMILGHFGRMEMEKNHLYLIDVFKAYHKLNSESFLILIGEGELKEEIQKKVNEYGLENNVHFLGVGPDHYEWFQAMDIFLFPSLFDGVPITLIEAQAAGLPIIASDNITKEVQITDLVYFKMIEEEPNQWAKKIDDLYLLFREDMTERIIEAGFDVKDTAKELENYYFSILKEGS